VYSQLDTLIPGPAEPALDETGPLIVPPKAAATSSFFNREHASPTAAGAAPFACDRCVRTAVLAATSTEWVPAMIVKIMTMLTGGILVCTVASCGEFEHV